MSTWNETEWKNALEEVSRRAAFDPDFRSLALSDPATALSVVAERNAPSDLKVVFVDNSGPIKTIPLQDPVPEIEELNDLELAEAIGGAENNTIGVSVSWSR